MRPAQLEKRLICNHDNRKAAAGTGTGGALTAAPECGGLRRMNDAEKELSRLVGAVIGRFFEQNGRRGPPEEDRVACGARLWALLAERGLPRAPGSGGPGVAAAAVQPGGIGEEECTVFAARVAGGTTDDLLATAAKQLVKACFYPELAKCRDSWREVATDGGCRRQELKRVRGRVSGTHCVDCPHWVELPVSAHEAMLEAAWHSGPEDFRRHRGEFLPEDFRALRRWLHAAARRTDEME
jgi:hypothetical protein